MTPIGCRNRSAEVTTAFPLLPPLHRQAAASQNPALTLVLDELVLACFLAGVLVLCNKPGASMDEDLWWHLRTGVWILQHHSVPFRDTFAASINGQPWVEYTWLFDLLVFGIYSVWRLPGVLAFTGILILASTSALLALLSRYTALHRAVGLTTAALFGIGTLASPRPWLFTVLFFLAEMYLLLKARETGRAAWLWLLLPLFALWANLHVQFIYGLITIIIFALEAPFARFVQWGPSSNRLRARWLWIFLALCSCATLLNPYGWRLYSVVWQYSVQHTALSFIQEMQPIQFRSASDWVPWLLACAAFFVLAALKHTYPVFVLLLAVACWFGFRSARDMWFLVIVAALIIANAMPAPSDNRYRFIRRAWAFALPVSFLIGYALLRSPHDSETSLQAALEKRFPEKAASYIQSHALQQPLYNTFNWGGFLIWRLPDMPVSIDGRVNLYGDARLQRFANTWLGRSDWANDHALKTARTILLDRNCPLASILRSHPRYRLVYQDELASVFEPVQ